MLKQLREMTQPLRSVERGVWLILAGLASVALVFSLRVGELWLDSTFGAAWMIVSALTLRRGVSSIWREAGWSYRARYWSAYVGMGIVGLANVAVMDAVFLDDHHLALVAIPIGVASGIITAALVPGPERWYRAGAGVRV